jgi:formylglycine-generating enzyme
MKNINSLFIFAIFLWVSTPSVFGQGCRDYYCVINRVKRLLDQKDYRRALDNLDSAEGYPDSKEDEIRTLRRRIFILIEEAKNEAEKAKIEAEMFKQKIGDISNICDSYQCIIEKVNINLTNKNFQVAFDYLSLAGSYKERNDLEISQLRDRFFKLMDIEKNGSKLKNYSCNNYDCIIAKVKKALKIKDYKTTFDNLEAAAGHPNKNDKQISDLRKKLFDEVEKDKINALISRREAFTSAFELSKIKNELKENQKGTEQVLLDLRNASDQAVQLLLNEIDRNILLLEYDSTFEKCRIALNLKSEKYGQQLKERILEIAYWYTETDTFEAAIKTLNLLNINTLSNRVNLLEAIRKDCSPLYFTFLEERYYPKMNKIKGGEFIMGSANGNEDEKPLHKVQISNFNISVSEVTVWQYFLFIKSSKYLEPVIPIWQWIGNTPIVNISWDDSQFYLKWLSKRKNDKFRLPTEAEWEFGAKGGVKTDLLDSKLTDYAWFYLNSKNQANPVRKRESNILGLYDVLGNVWEWCNDIYDASYYENCITYNIINDPKGAQNGENHVIRGGSWSSTDKHCRVTVRKYLFPYSKNDDIGFRIVND